MTNYYCQACKHTKILMNLLGNRFCFYCFKSTRNHISITISETMSVRDSLKLKGKSSLFRKFKFFIQNGWQPSKKVKHGVHLFRSFDKEKDWYSEEVKDYKTGKILHKNEEKLSDHTGHGSAKTNFNNSARKTE